MPNCFLCNDDKQEISKESIFRRDFNLPDQGFIFTCFNNNYKITKKEFNIWMNLLIKTEGSVLWLYKSNQWAKNKNNANYIGQTRLFWDSLLTKKWL